MKRNKKLFCEKCGSELVLYSNNLSLDNYRQMGYTFLIGKPSLRYNKFNKETGEKLDLTSTLYICPNYQKFLGISNEHRKVHKWNNEKDVAMADMDWWCGY